MSVWMCGLESGPTKWLEWLYYVFVEKKMNTKSKPTAKINTYSRVSEWLYKINQLRSLQSSFVALKAEIIAYLHTVSLKPLFDKSVLLTEYISLIIFC